MEGDEREGKGRKGGWGGVGHTFEVAATLGLEFFAPSPDGIKDQAHAHTAPDLELQRAVGAVSGRDRLSRAGSAASPKLCQDLG